MKTQNAVLKQLALATSALVWCAVNVHAQSGPTITNQPVSQTNLAGTSVTFSAGVDGNGPFTYQWQFNGTNLPSNIISTVAGNGISGYSGDGVAATNAWLRNPHCAVFDAVGNLYIADWHNNRIRRVDTNGIIRTVAGTGTGGYSGDGGAATTARLYNPESVVPNTLGELYISDAVNHRIRKVDAKGIITTVAGNGSGTYSGDGGAATNASLNAPCGIALDAVGNLYVADFQNNRIRKVDTNGIITTVAGQTGAGYSGDGGAATNANLYYPFGIALGATGNFYISDQNNNRIRMVDTNGIIATVAGNGSAAYAGDGGTATNASLHYPQGVALDAVGDLYIADYNNNRIRKVDASGIITTVAGSGNGGFAGDGGTATNALLQWPVGVAFDTAGNLYIADASNCRIRKVLLDATYPTLTLRNVRTANSGGYTVVVSSPSGSVTSAVATLTVALPPSILVQPASQGILMGGDATLTVTAMGTAPLYYLWYFNATNLVQSGTNASCVVTNISADNAGQYMVVVSNAYSSVSSRVATLAFPPSVTTQPASQTNLLGANVTFGVTADGVGPFTYQWQFNGTNFPNNIITTIAGSGSGSYSGDGGPATNAGVFAPAGVTLDGAGNLYIADNNDNRVRKVGTNGIITTVAGNTNATYAGDGGVATNASLSCPNSMALDAAGNLYIADANNNRIRRVDNNGIITTVAGNGSGSYTGDGGLATNASLYWPAGVALDAAGKLYIAEINNSRVRKVDINGIITTVAGKASAGYSGDGGAATNASLYQPQGVALDAVGNLYIGDTSNNRIRKVDTSGMITTVAGNGNGSYSGDGGAATNASLNGPQGVCFDVAGNLYIADVLNKRIRKVDTKGMITTVAGNGSAAYAGDGGGATNASLSFPMGVASDAAGNLYIADWYNNRIREVHLAGYPTLTLSNLSVGNAGNYTVVVTSPYGYVTSAVAVLTVTIPHTPPQIIVNDASFGFRSNWFGFNLSGAFGQTIVVDGSTNLADWAPLFTNTVVDSPFYFSDPASTSMPWRFYRARLP